MRFIGSKERLLPFIGNALDRYVGPERGTISDLFCGTAVVSRYFKRLGFKVVANDNLTFCYMLARAAVVLNDEPQFDQLIRSGRVRGAIVDDLFASRYEAVLAHLNALRGEPGFICKEYSPGGTRNKKFNRSYFSDSNAQRIDAIRAEIGRWRSEGLISETEFCLLISDLIRAANRVANIAGTYGCFIKHWDARAHRALHLERSEIIPSRHANEAHCSDAHDVAKERYFDVLYLDPPYTWRHYGAYYHIPESLAIGDAPAVTGKTGLRPWEQSKSRYCDRSEARNALSELISSAKCSHLLLSYNSEGLISHSEIMSTLRDRGKPVCLEVDHRRYKSNKGGKSHSQLKERLYYVRIA